MKWALLLYVTFRTRKRRAYAQCILKNLKISVYQHEKAMKHWRTLPGRLRGRAHWMLQKEIEEALQEARCTLPDLIALARMWGKTITPEQEREMLQIAFEQSPPTKKGKIFFAQKLHGSRPPIDVIRSIAEAFEEVHGNSFGHRVAAFYGIADFHLFVALIDPCSTGEVRIILQIFARKGQYRLLKSACEQLNQPIPVEFLKLCYKVSKQRDFMDCKDMTEMCIALKDWKFGEKLIITMKDNEKLHNFIAKIFLAMHEARGQSEWRTE